MVEAEAGPSRTKRKSTLYDKNKCIFCQSDHESHQLHNFQTASIGGRIICILEKSNNPIFNVIRATFVDNLDVQAHDTKYHWRCLTEEKRRALLTDICILPLIKNVDIKIINAVKIFVDQGQIISMNDINVFSENYMPRLHHPANGR